jgi:hypothetical protein
VAFFATNIISAQEVCTSSQTFNPDNNQLAQFICAGGRLLWTTTTFNGTNGEPIRWTIVGDTSGGAKFVVNNGTTYDTTLSGPLNSILVQFGPLAGSVEVRMSYINNPTATGCNSSGNALKVVVNGTPSTQQCAQDTGTITAVAGTILLEGTTPANIGPYTYVLNPGGATNTTGIFSGLAPGDYTVSATNTLGCGATSPTIHLQNPAVIPVHAVCPGNKSDNSCIYADQAAVDAAYAAWRAQFSYNGGTLVNGQSSIVPTYTSSTGLDAAPPLCGGSVTVRLDVVDVCQQKDNCTATFEVIAPPGLVPHAPADFSGKACDFATVADIQNAYNAWIAGATVTGGCKPTIAPLPNILPGLCGGSVPVTFHATDRCNLTGDATANFIIVKPADVVPVIPPDITIKACDIVDLADLQARVAAFEKGFSASGGCKPEVAFDPVQFPSNFCQGVLNITGKITDRCIDAIPINSHINIMPAPTINPHVPADLTVDACAIIDANDMQTRITALEGQFSVDGGCAPKLVFDPVTLPTNLCTGTITITGHISDKCATDIPVTTHIIIHPASTVQYAKPADFDAVACTLHSQQDVVNAYNTWVAGFKIVSGGCAPTIKVTPPTLPSFCGGSVPVHATVSDKCATDVDVVANFTVETAPAPIINKCVPDFPITKCNPAPSDFPAPGTPDVTSLCPAKITSSDGPVIKIDDCHRKLVRTYKVTTDCYPDGVTCTQNITWKEDTTAPTISGLTDKTIPGGDEDSGLCTPTTTVGGPSFTPPAFKGSSNVSVDFGQVRTGDAPDEVLSWTNGTTTAQSQYFEGMGVPQRVLLSGLKKGAHTLYIRHEAVKKQDAARHAYDFLMSWNQAIATGENIGNGTRSELQNLNKQECDGNWSGAGQAQCQGMTTNAIADIPDTMGNPPDQTGIANVDDVIKCFEGIYGNRTMEMEGTSAITGFNVKFLGYDGSDAKSDFAWYAISWTSDSPAVELKFAGRMAMGGGKCGYGNCHGAGSIKGNPYHIILEGLDGASMGQRDNQTKCLRSQTCDVNIPVKFDTPTATDCDPATVTPTIVVGKEDVITHNADGTVTHCRTWTATDACGNTATATQCITVVCALGANFGDLGIVKLVSTTSRMMDNTTITPEPIQLAGTTGLSNLKVYPNPFSHHFNVDLNTESVEPVQLNVYDMLGRNIDTINISKNNTNIGSMYPTGVYNLIFNQATETKTVRIIKNE